MTSDPVVTVSGEESVGTVVGRVVADAKAYAGAEVTLWKAVAADRGSAAGVAIGLGAGAALIASSALTALLVGLILTLATRVGPGFATLIVVVAAFVVAAMLGLAARSRIAKVTRPLGDDA